ncbi:hypothetical protein K504DRAFT_460801 [Pleomassaria siparia CBS 279.74]|uniref:Telomere replication protein EST3 n=1 Tax=Pleomassaria siparia CBS 279.74 TaxID=1314801 RepID=A0A6G1JWM8_9PLEO|nr:hypothetical protein K504DRAFT_460801 [Pleomassaria siparia CBS 279.74]
MPTYSPPPPPPPPSPSPSPPPHTWLAETIVTQLHLGHHWHREQLTKKLNGIKPDPDAHWIGLFEDNGSCLDITNDVDPEQSGIVQIVKVNPLTISDGSSLIEAVLSPKCSQHLRKTSHNTPIGRNRLVSIRKYTIRHTPYGPPRQRLLLILEAADYWQNIQIEGVLQAADYWQDIQKEGVLGEPTPIRSSEGVRVALQLLNNVRGEASRHTFSRQDQPDVADTMSQSVDIWDEHHECDSTLHTQIPFGTQAAGASGSRPAQNGPGKSHAQAMTSASNVDPRRAMLLGLLGGKQSHSVPRSPIPTASHSELVSRPVNNTDRSKPRTSTERPLSSNNNPRLAASIPKSGAGQSTEGLHDRQSLHMPTSTALTDNTAGAQEPPHQISEKHSSKAPKGLDTPASESDWMTGWIFSYEVTKVPKEQQSLLDKPETWQKPPPGHRFPDSNIPIKDLTELWRRHDESVAANMEVEVEASDPDFGLQIDQHESPVSEHEAEIEHASTSSAISWSPSPSPKRLKQKSELPPDSSLHIDEDEQPLNPPSTAWTKRVQPTIIQESIDIDSSNDKGTADPPSSPPLAREEEDSDEDMEMEVSVPQGLGEDNLEVSMIDVDDIPTPGLIRRANSVVQVKETPLVDRRMGLSASSISVPSCTSNHTSSAEMKETSSTSIVYGTYHEPQQRANQGLRRASADPKASNSQSQDHSQDQDEDRVHQSVLETGELGREGKRVRFPSTERDDRSVLGPSSNPTPIPGPSSYQPGLSLILTPLEADLVDVDMQSIQLEESPISAQVPLQEPNSSGNHSSTDAVHVADLQAHFTQPTSTQPHVPSVAAKKRKFENVSSKKGIRRAKRREIKVVDFGARRPLIEDLGDKSELSDGLKDARPDAEVASFDKLMRGFPLPSHHFEHGRHDDVGHADKGSENIGTVQDTDVEMEEPSLQTAHKTSLFEESANTFTTPSSGIVNVTHDKEVVSSAPQEGSIQTGPAHNQAAPIVSPSDLATFALDEHAISSTRPEDFAGEDIAMDEPVMSVDQGISTEPSGGANRQCNESSRDATPSEEEQVHEERLMQIHEQVVNKDKREISTRMPAREKDQSRLSNPNMDIASHHGTGALELPLSSKSNHLKAVESIQRPPSVITVAPTTVFERFKAAYPEYTGNAKHFMAQLKLMFELEEEEKMVPKWQWDDYLIRSLTDYKTYVMKCMDDGETQEIYNRFYKDRIEEPIHRKGILNQATLTSALNELQGNAPVVEAVIKRAPQSQISMPDEAVVNRTPSQARQSLPSSTALARSLAPKKAVDRGSARIRQSLPSSAAQNTSPASPRRKLPWASKLLAEEPPERPREERKTSSARTAIKPHGYNNQPIQRPPLKRHSSGISIASHMTSTNTPTPASTKPLARQGQTDKIVQRSHLSAASSNNTKTVGAPRSEPTASDDDPFRNMWRAHRTMTSHTGDNRYDPHAAWPQNLAGRRTVETKRGPVDVLGWKDDV